MFQHYKDNWIAAGAMVAVVAVATLFVYMPQSRKVNKLKQQTVEKRLAVEESLVKASAVPQMARQVQEMKSRYRNFDRRLPKQKELGSFLSEISGNLNKEKLTTELMQPGKPSSDELFFTLPIIMKFKGSFLSMASFLKRIDQMERLTRVQRLMIVRDPKSNDLNVEMNMNIYFTES